MCVLILQNSTNNMHFFRSYVPTIPLPTLLQGLKKLLVCTLDKVEKYVLDMRCKQLGIKLLNHHRTN